MSNIKLLGAVICAAVLLAAGLGEVGRVDLHNSIRPGIPESNTSETANTASFPQIGQDTQYFDLNLDGEKEKLVLDDGSLQVLADDQVVWFTPEDWQVDFFFPGDATNDGVPELSLVVWRKESYGSVKPFWVEEEDDSLKCHLFLFRLEEDREMRPIWQSSRLPHPVYRAELNDLNEDGENKLLVTGGCYRDPGVRELSIWKWDEFGFTRVD